jgi:hypothetical protein
MKYFNILLMIGALLGGIVGAAVEVPSYAASGALFFLNGETPYTYFPKTGNIIADNCYYRSSYIAKYNLPKNLTKSKLNSLKGDYSGVEMRMVGNDGIGGAKAKNWAKKLDKFKTSDYNMDFNPTNNISGLTNYLNNTKFDLIYQRARLTFRSNNSTAKNHELLWTNVKPKGDCGT